MISLLGRQKVIAENVNATLSQSELLTNEFANYLVNQRGLAQSTVRCYSEFVLRFLKAKNLDGGFSVSSLSADDVIDFVRNEARAFRSKRGKLVTSALRSFLRFARYHNYIPIDLACAVPAVPCWSLTTIPKALNKEHVEAILHHTEHNSCLGLRDYAILLLLARLGLRAGEVANLLLDDLDWQEGSIRIRGKGGQYSKLPIPKDVGEAIVEYLQNGRLATEDSRAVFLRCRSPHVAFKSGVVVGNVVKRALKRAGINSRRNGAHQLRHALACEMLRAGASLSEIGELLRHHAPQSTMIYAKVDESSLRSLALPWPGGDRA
ncbi:MAG: tyrosine-type recombinase/integrase [Nitrososphaerales archaeon]